MELRVGYDPKPKLVTYLQGYLFADAGKVWNCNMPPSDDSYEIASAGFGTRLSVEDRMTLTAELAKPLTRPPAENRDKDWRGLFSIAVAR